MLFKTGGITTCHLFAIGRNFTQIEVSRRMKSQVRVEGRPDKSISILPNHALDGVI